MLHEDLIYQFNVIFWEGERREQQGSSSANLVSTGF